MLQTSPFTVIIPAHNEEAVIARCLRTIQQTAPAQHGMQIIVAANGCSDRTVAIARTAAPAATVLDLTAASKTAAINAANRIAAHCPRIYVDADVECSYAALVALADALRHPKVMTAAPAIRLSLSGCSLFVRAYYRAWSRQPYASAGKGGAGCYGLSRQALAQVEAFPPIIGDDIWIHTRFADEQKRYVTHDSAGQKVFSVVYPPRTAWQQIKVEARRRIGTDEVRRLYPSPYLANASNGGGFSAAIRSGASAADLIVFFTLKLCARILARWRQLRGRAMTWTRDLSTREA